MARVAAAIAVVAACAAAVLFTGASDKGGGKRYKVVFDNAFGLVEGGEVKIGGVSAGEIKSFALTGTEPERVAAEFEVTKPGFSSLRRDARCDVRQQSLIGEYFVDCQPGRSRERLRNDTVPVEQTSSTVPLDLVQNVMRKPYRERFRIIIGELGAGLAGRPDDLNEVVRRAHPALRETSETLEILADQNRVISDFIRDADRVSVAVEPRKRDVSRWAKEASETASIQASRAEQLGRQWNRLPRFLTELEPTLAALQRTANRQIPTLRRMQAAAPDLEAFLTELGPFADASRTSLRALGRSAGVGREALEESKEEIAELRRLSVDAPRLARPLRQFLQTIDDRGRSIENDPEAAKVAPPAPDKTSDAAGKGFTGMEALLNYFYWQTLGINAFDEVSHMLRIALIQNKCSPYVNDPSKKDVLRDCNSWLGPYQPGVNAEDPTAGPRASSRERESESESEPEAEGEPRTEEREAAGGEPERRGAGEPEAPPLPGQPDLSKPQITLPPQLQELLDELPKTPEGVPELPEGSDDLAPDQLLDYLLAP
jgi:virulence factor Mce-like protein